MPADQTDKERDRCIPTEIYTDVVQARVAEHAEVIRRLRVYKPIADVDFCAAETTSARVEVRERGWEVSALFKIAVGFDPGHRERVIRTIAFFKTHIPFPLTTAPRPIDFRKLEARVKIADLDCDASVGEDGRVIIAVLRFEVVVYAMEDDVITVCRLRGRAED